MIEHRQYKYPLYPTKEQAEELTCWIGCGRWIWNYAVQINKIYYEIDQKFLWRFDLQDQLPFLKELYPWLDEVPASAQKIRYKIMTSH
jgi:putative transposase